MTELLPLGSIATVIMGQAPPGDTYNTDGEGLPFFQGKAEFGKEFPVPVKWCSAPTRVAEPGDILLSVRAPVGPTNVALERCCIGRGLAAIHPKDGRVTGRYLLHFLRRFELDLVQRGVGSTFTAINRKDIEQFKISVPPLAEQERAVDVLDRADRLRQLRATAEERTSQLTQAIFLEMFGDPGDNSKGWPIVSVGELLVACDYGTSQKAHIEPVGTPILRMNNVTSDGALNLDDLKYVELDDADSHKYRLHAGDVLFNRTNSKELVGKTGLWDARFEAVAASYFIRLRFDEAKENPSHFVAFMNLPSTKRRLMAMARGAIGQSNINAKELRSIRLPCPPIDLQRTFADFVQEIHSLELKQIQSRQSLDQLFESLLTTAFSGKGSHTPLRQT